MTREQIATLLERVDAWPEAAQTDLVSVAQAIEAELSGAYEATPAELEGIDRGLRDAEAGRFAKHRPAQGHRQ